MITQRTYSNIYFSHNESYIHLLLYNNINGEALFFDGLNFVQKSAIKEIPAGYEELKNTSGNASYEVEMVRQRDDMTFVKFANGDIFQLHYMPCGYGEIEQALLIFRKEEEHGIGTVQRISAYDAAQRRLIEAEDCEILSDN